MPNHIDNLDDTDWGSDAGSPPAPISLGDVESAYQIIAPLLAPTPLIEHPLLSSKLGTETLVKLENVQRMGAFKIRGALNLLAKMDQDARRKGIVTATRGNYGVALAEACSMHDVECTVFVPQGNSPDKNAAVVALGGNLVTKGHDFDAAWDASVRHARKIGAISIHPAKHPELVAGQGTVALEMLEQLEAGLDVLFIPVGGGSLAAGVTTVMKAKSPQTRLIAVQAENAPAFHHAWHTREFLPMVANETIADGLATRVPVRYTLSMMRELDDFVLVSEEEICHPLLRPEVTPTSRGRWRRALGRGIENERRACWPACRPDFIRRQYRPDRSATSGSTRCAGAYPTRRS